MTAARGKVFGSALWSVATRWSDRVIGFVSTIILARILAPQDFGIVAMATIVVGLVEVLVELGVNLALIYHKDASREDFDTAWTIRLIQMAVIGTVVAAVSPLAAIYFRDPNIIPVLCTLAVALALSGLENIGVVNFQKNMDFRSDFMFFVRKRIPSFLITIAMALVLKSYWALVIGTVASRVIGVVVSYQVHPHRPRWCLTRIRKIWNMSRWMILRSIGGYLDTRADLLVVGRRGGAEGLGLYSTANDLAALPTSELLIPLSRVLLPAFVDVRDDAQRLRSHYLLALGVQSLVGIPCAVGVALVAAHAVPLFLGPKWLAAIPLMQILALLGGISAIGYSGAYLLTALGRIGLLAAITWISMAIYLTINVVVFPSGGIEFLAASRLGLGVAGSAVFMAIVIRQVPGLRWMDCVRVIARPLFAAALMVYPVMWVGRTLGDDHLAGFAAQVVVGAAIYIGVTALLWWGTGRSGRIEGYILEKAGKGHWVKAA